MIPVLPVLRTFSASCVMELHAAVIAPPRHMDSGDEVEENSCVRVAAQFRSLRRAASCIGTARKSPFQLRMEVMAGFRLPSKLPACRLRLHAYYSSRGDDLMRDLIGNSHAYVEEDTVSDGWNPGGYGHDVQLFLPMEDLNKVDIDKIDRIANKIAEDLNRVSTNVPDEYFANVHLELFDEDDENCQHARPLGARPERNPDTLSIWKTRND